MKTARNWKKLFFLSCLVLISIFCWLFATTGNDVYRIEIKTKQEVSNIRCLINDEENITCLKWLDKYYIPYEYLSRKFDLQSKEEQDGYFRVKFTNSKIYTPSKGYNHQKEYLWFRQVNVEQRDRVLYISLNHGVPISSQWNKSGHIYPIQVAQFGLSHLSKSNKNTPSARFIIDENNYFMYDKNTFNKINSTKIGFEFKLRDRAIYKTKQNCQFISGDIFTKTRFKLEIDFMYSSKSEANRPGRLIYSFEKSTQLSESLRVDKSENLIEYFLASQFKSTLRIVRNICVDVCKGLGLKCDQCLVIDEPPVRVYQIGVSGEGRVDNGFLFDSKSTPNFELAQLAADYLVSSQNSASGGWMINITRKFDKTLKLSLPKNWYSAMAQGQAISLLCRLYSITKLSPYLNAAKKALQLFEIDAGSGGVRAHFNDGIWFEEYPTQPYNLFVLNGFIYSIFGLIDYLKFCGGDSKAHSLFNDSIKSLVGRINYYDTGTRTLYDLRHLSDPELYPNVARWDYHTLHVSQLYYLVDTIKKSGNYLNGSSSYGKPLESMAKRWHNYVYGVWNKESQIIQKFNF